MKIEQEIRFYFSDEELPKLVKKLAELYEYDYSYHEITTMYDNPNPELTFYSNEMDGRLRLRYSKAVDSDDFVGLKSKDIVPDSKCLITWKRRLPQFKDEQIRHEEEIEYSVSANEFDSVRAIFEDVLGCKRVSSYERIRTFFSTDGVQVTCDKFPYGVMLELEVEGDGTAENLYIELQRLELDRENASRLSCDDMYFKLCQDAGVTPLPDITFYDKSMPKIIR